jgi:hypothetical protein
LTSLEPHGNESKQEDYEQHPGGDNYTPQQRRRLVLYGPYIFVTHTLTLSSLLREYSLTLAQPVAPEFSVHAEDAASHPTGTIHVFRFHL